MNRYLKSNFQRKKIKHMFKTMSLYLDFKSLRFQKLAKRLSWSVQWLLGQLACHLDQGWMTRIILYHEFGDAKVIQTKYKYVTPYLQTKSYMNPLYLHNLYKWIQVLFWKTKIFTPIINQAYIQISSNGAYIHISPNWTWTYNLAVDRSSRYCQT